MTVPTLEQIASLKLRLRTLPDELNVAREAAARLGALLKECKLALSEQEAEVAVFTRAEWCALAKDKKPSEAVLAAADLTAAEVRLLVGGFGA